MLCLDVGGGDDDVDCVYVCTCVCVCVYVQAIERGIHFEILYSPAVRDSTFRQNIISSALQLYAACKGKVSSGNSVGELNVQFVRVHVSVFIYVCLWPEYV